MQCTRCSCAPSLHTHKHLRASLALCLRTLAFPSCVWVALAASLSSFNVLICCTTASVRAQELLEAQAELAKLSHKVRRWDMRFTARETKVSLNLA